MESPNSPAIPVVTSAKLPWEIPLCLPLDAAAGTESGVHLTMNEASPGDHNYAPAS